MWTLSGFSDEISPDPREQVASALGLKSAASPAPSCGTSVWKTFTDILNIEGIEYS